MVQRQVLVSTDKCLTKKFGVFPKWSKLIPNAHFMLISSTTFYFNWGSNKGIVLLLIVWLGSLLDIMALGLVYHL